MDVGEIDVETADQFVYSKINLPHTHHPKRTSKQIRTFPYLPLPPALIIFIVIVTKTYKSRNIQLYTNSRSRVAM